ncbi:hypothetical protein [Nitratireductor sp. ZSWI3]|uniref:hypothetical protein n=1 Tax=Nitratireductor sp. ZSWI3 TaxID=2966359 RepID=UPI00214FAD46|nr:hypothetical protein [Nitratireductor sp. ZSWI3]MCR4268460.1 hypothetical protein [Nitratireductor sp. ZSWI3]
MEELMRPIASTPFILLAGFLAGCTTADDNTVQTPIAQKQCEDYGFAAGTDGYANCMMQLSLRQGQPMDHSALVDQYTSLSMARRGDDRYPVCTASDMDNELNTSLNKWVGANCQMAPD